MKTNRDYLYVALLAACFFFVEALVWPLHMGRDGNTYLYYFYDFGSAHPEDWFTMMFRTPLAPFFDGFLIEVLGPRLAEWFMGAVFVGVMLLHFWAGLIWGRRTAWVFITLVLLHFAYGSLFHVVSNDPSVAIVFALLLGAALYCALNPAPQSFALLGFCACLMQMARPGIFGYVGLLALLLGGITWRRRIALFVFFLIAFLPGFLGWVAHNYRAYGVMQYSVGTEVFLPLGRLLAVDDLVRVENGPASREMGALIERSELKKPEYQGWDANRYLRSVHQYGWLMALVDRELGPGHYRLLNAMGWEAVRAHPFIYARGVALTFLQMMAGNLKLPVPLANGALVVTHKGLVAFQKNGADTAMPLAEVNPHSLQRDPIRYEVHAKIGPKTLRAYQAELMLPVRDGEVGIGSVFNWLCYLFPPMLLWQIAAAVLALAYWRRLLALNVFRALALVWTLAVLTDFAACLGMWVPIYQYRLPFDVAFVLLPLALAYEGNLLGLRENKTRFFAKDASL